MIFVKLNSRGGRAVTWCIETRSAGLEQSDLRVDEGEAPLGPLKRGGAGARSKQEEVDEGETLLGPLKRLERLTKDVDRCRLMGRDSIGALKHRLEALYRKAHSADEVRLYLAH